MGWVVVGLQGTAFVGLVRTGCGDVLGWKSFALGTGPIDKSVSVAQSNTAVRTSFVVSCFTSSFLSSSFSSFLSALLSSPFPGPNSSRSPGFVSCCLTVVCVAVVTAVAAAAAMVVVSTIFGLSELGAVVTASCHASISRSGGSDVAVVS